MLKLQYTIPTTNILVHDDTHPSLLNVKTNYSAIALTISHNNTKSISNQTLSRICITTTNKQKLLWASTMWVETKHPQIKCYGQVTGSLKFTIITPLTANIHNIKQEK